MSVQKPFRTTTGPRLSLISILELQFSQATAKLRKKSFEAAAACWLPWSLAIAQALVAKC